MGAVRRLVISSLRFAIKMTALACLIALGLGASAPPLPADAATGAAESYEYDDTGYAYDRGGYAPGSIASTTGASVRSRTGWVRPASESVRGPLRLSSDSVAPSGLADDGARFVVDSTGTTTLRAQGPSGWIDVSSHAARRMTQRGISIDAVDNALTTQPFNYWHNNTWKVGYYDDASNVFVGTVNGVATTVIQPSSGPQYIANLLAASP